jgi:hypothetical protein
MGLTLEKMVDAESPQVPYFTSTVPFEETKVGFMSGRRMFNNVGIGGGTMKEQQALLTFPAILDATRCVLTRVVQSAHDSRINSVKAIKIAPYGFITTSLDKSVKVWTQEG